MYFNTVNKIQPVYKEHGDTDLFARDQDKRGDCIGYELQYCC
jgi:hypothetical protein